MMDDEAVVKQKTKKLPTRWSSASQAVYYELDHSSLLCQEATFHNKDSVVFIHQIAERQNLTISTVSLPSLDNFLDYDQTSSLNLEKKRLKETQELSAVQIPMIDYKNLLHLLAFEKSFNHSVGFKDWRFRNRTVWEEMCQTQFSQVLSDLMQAEPELLSFFDEETDCLHLAFFFKSVPGRILYKQWKAEQVAVPSFSTYCQMDELSKAKRNYIHLAEDDIGIIRERRVLALPADNSRIDLRQAQAFHQSRSRSSIYKRDVVLGLSSTSEQEIHILKEIVKKEMSGIGQKANTLAEIPEEEVNTDTHTAKVSSPDDEIHHGDSSFDALFDEKVKNLKEHLSSACDFFINFGNNPRILFETSLQRVDQ